MSTIFNNSKQNEQLRRGLKQLLQTRDTWQKVQNDKLTPAPVRNVQHIKHRIIQILINRQNHCWAELMLSNYVPGNTFLILNTFSQKMRRNSAS